MKIFTVTQIKDWDRFTIQHEPISSIQLMERAATACSKWIIKHINASTNITVFCAKGNNGGDGLAIARHLIENRFTVSVYIIGEKTGTNDFEKNLEALYKISNDIYFLSSEKAFPAVNNGVVLDALFGTGLNKIPTGLFSQLILHINKFAAHVISIDMPSGLFADVSSVSDEIIKAQHTLSFQNQKLAFLVPENESYIGEVILLDIQLSKEFASKTETPFEWTGQKKIGEIYKPRKSFTNKGDFGYACLISGSYGMMGASILSASACLRSGVGKLNCFIPSIGYGIMQTSVPEAMCTTFGTSVLENVEGFENFDTIGIGPGMGNYPSHKALLQNLFSHFNKPMVIDADALNALSEHPSLYKLIPKKSIITPHPKEFERLFGPSDSDFSRINLALQKAEELHIYIVLKGHYTFIATPERKGYFNSTGNAGMATAGAGDVLTGIITGLLAQKYSPLDACILGTYLHGMAGDIAALKISKEALLASSIVKSLGKAFKTIS